MTTYRVCKVDRWDYCSYLDRDSYEAAKLYFDNNAGDEDLNEVWIVCKTPDGKETITDHWEA